MSALDNIQSKILSGAILYIISGIGLYLLSLLLGTLVKVFFDVSFISHNGVEVDVVTYIAFGSIDFFLTLLQIIFSAGIVILIWLYNFFVVDIIFWILDEAIYLFLQVRTFSLVDRISDQTIQDLVNAISIIVDMFRNMTFDLLVSASEAGESVWEGVNDPTDDRQGHEP